MQWVFSSGVYICKDLSEIVINIQVQIKFPLHWWLQEVTEYPPLLCKYCKYFLTNFEKFCSRETSKKHCSL